MSPHGADLQCLNRKFEIIPRACRRCKMHHSIHFRADIYEFRDIVLVETEALVTDEVRNIIHASRQKIIQTGNFMPHFQKTIALVTAEESSTARDYNMHFFLQNFYSIFGDCNAPVAYPVNPVIGRIYKIQEYYHETQCGL